MIEEGSAERQWNKAIAEGEDPAAVIVRAALAFADSPLGRSGGCPKPSVWISRKRYRDDPESWPRVPDHFEDEAKAQRDAQAERAKRDRQTDGIRTAEEVSRTERQEFAELDSKFGDALDAMPDEEFERWSRGVISEICMRCV